MFKDICGRTYENFVVLTTFWDRLVNGEEGFKRGAQLKTEAFKDLKGGAQFMRHDNSAETARQVFEQFFPTDLNRRLARLKENMANIGKVIEDMQARHEEVMRFLNEGMNDLQQQLERRVDDAQERQTQGASRRSVCEE